MTEEYGLPEEVEDTAIQERKMAETRVASERVAAGRTSLVIDMLQAATSHMAELHVENGYALKLRAIFRS